MLYLVPTPIGNLQDMTLRALEILVEVDYILCEDKRVTGRLLKHFNVDAQLVSFHAHNEHGRLQAVLDDLEQGLDIALVSDAGSPGISDPGFLLVRACHEAGLACSSLPGASALVPALSNSGLPMNRFHFEGFLPTKKGRQTRLQHLATLTDTFVIYESPHRILKCIDQLMTHCGRDRLACLNRELTKMHEEILQGTLETIQQQLQGRDRIKGEIVLVVAGK